MKNETDKKKSFLISVEGIDGSGKSTICSLLSDYLNNNNIKTVLTKEPGGTELGKTIREILQHQTAPLDPTAEFLLFAADRAQHVKTMIEPTLAQGCSVISDRMHDSSMAYQGYGRGLSLEKIQIINEWAMKTCRPDATIYLRLDPAIAHERISLRNEKKTRFENEEKEFWQRITAGFDQIFKDHPKVIVIEATSSPAEILKQIIAHPLFVALVSKEDNAFAS